jgi:hypothetical protein
VAASLGTKICGWSLSIWGFLRTVIDLKKRLWTIGYPAIPHSLLFKFLCASIPSCLFCSFSSQPTTHPLHLRVPSFPVAPPAQGHHRAGLPSRPNYLRPSHRAATSKCGMLTPLVPSPSGSPSLAPCPSQPRHAYPPFIPFCTYFSLVVLLPVRFKNLTRLSFLVSRLTPSHLFCQ